MSLSLLPNININYAQKYIRLLEEHTAVKNELKLLKKECEENTIISSMNDMKLSYEIQEKKIEKLRICISDMHNYNKTAKVMSEVLSKNIDDYVVMRSYKHELCTRLDFISEILEMSLKIKNELLYLDY